MAVNTLKCSTDGEWYSTPGSLTLGDIIRKYSGDWLGPKTNLNTVSGKKNVTLAWNLTTGLPLVVTKVPGAELAFTASVTYQLFYLTNVVTWCSAVLMGRRMSRLR